MDKRNEVDQARAMLKRSLMSSVWPSTSAIVDALNNYIDAKARTAALKGWTAKSSEKSNSPPSPS